jgi:hypothetical protein
MAMRPEVSTAGLSEQFLGASLRNFDPRKGMLSEERDEAYNILALIFCTLWAGF